MYTAVFTGKVMETRVRKREGKADVPEFTLYQKGASELMVVEGVGVKEGQDFNGPLELSFLEGFSAKGKWAMLTFRKVDAK